LAPGPGGAEAHAHEGGKNLCGDEPNHSLKRAAAFPRPLCEQRARNLTFHLKTNPPPYLSGKKGLVKLMVETGCFNPQLWIGLDWVGLGWVELGWGQSNKCVVIARSF